MTASTTVASRLKRILAESSEEVFVRAELASLGSAAQVGRALRSLIADGVLVRLGVGVYAKAKKSILSGAPIPIRPVTVLTLVRLQIKKARDPLKDSGLFVCRAWFAVYSQRRTDSDSIPNRSSTLPSVWSTISSMDFGSA